MTAIQARKAKALERFLELLSESGNITLSAQGSGISRAWVYALMEKDASFRERVEQAREESVERLEAIARARAEAGSDLLLMFLLKANKPEKYRDHYKATISSAPADYVIDLAPS
jgi:hypothetical protein